MHHICVCKPALVYLCVSGIISVPDNETSGSNRTLLRVLSQGIALGYITVVGRWAMCLSIDCVFVNIHVCFHSECDVRANYRTFKAV